MNHNPNHSGVVIPLMTPVTAEGLIDEQAVAKIVQRIARHNLGVFVLGTTGETASIPRPERIRLVESVVRAADGKIPVYAGIGDNCLSNSILAANHYHELGVNAVVAHLPAYYPLTEGEMKDYFELLLNSLNGPLMLYNIPATTHMSVPVEVIQQLAELPNCVGFKDSENTPGRMESVYKAVGGNKDFALFMGSAILSVEALKLGYVGLVPSSGNLVPHLWEKLWNAAQQDDWSRAAELQAELDEISAVFQNKRTLGQSLAALKAAMAGIGLCRPDVLPPLQTFDPENVESIIRKITTLCPYLNDEYTTVHGDRG